jgi:proteasome lid subunit RPN8/RPN11
VLSINVVSVGTVSRTLVHPREVFADAIASRASAVIVAHNHPSGNLNPSQEDLEITVRLKKAGDLLGIRLLDHLVFSEKGTSPCWRPISLRRFKQPPPCGDNWSFTTKSPDIFVSAHHFRMQDR